MSKLIYPENGIMKVIFITSVFINLYYSDMLYILMFFKHLFS